MGRRLDTIKSSFRAWIGFLQQDELGTGATVADINKLSVARFRRWRMGAHSYEVEWGEKVYRHSSQGVSGEAVQRNIEDLRAALYHAEEANRIVAPKVPSVEKNQRSKPRDLVLTFPELGAILGYARHDEAAWRWIVLMIATAARPGAALVFDPARQWHGDVLDLQPVGVQRTDKRNAIVPVITPLKPILQAWKDKPHDKQKSRKTWWRSMRRVLGLPAEVLPYTIRHTVATFMDDEGVPGAALSEIAGHIPQHRRLSRTTSGNYLHYDPRSATKAKRALTKFFESAMREEAKWSADHLLSTPQRGIVRTVTRKDAKEAD